MEFSHEFTYKRIYQHFSMLHTSVYICHICCHLMQFKSYVCVFFLFFLRVCVFLFPLFIEIDSINKQFHKYKRKILYCGKNKYRSSTKICYIRVCTCIHCTYVHMYILQWFTSIVCPFHLKETENVWYHISESHMYSIKYSLLTSQFDRLPIPCANVNMQIIIVFAMCCLAKI